MRLRAEMTYQVVFVPPVAYRAELAFPAYLTFHRDERHSAEAFRFDFDFVAVRELKPAFFEFHFCPRISQTIFFTSP